MAMNKVLVFSLLLSVCYGIEKTKVDDSDVGLNIYQFLEKYSYPVEKHHVTTEDKYILELQRITSGRYGTHNVDGKPPILLVHGLGSSGMDYVNGGPGKSIGLMLADAGYDVWLGNCRGTTWSRNHESMNSTNKDFWQFSFNEIGYYDLPSKIDYILEVTGKEKLSYIGHSQGTTSFFIMGATRPEYNDKIQIMAALAPVAYMPNLGNPIVQFLAKPQFHLVVGFVLELLKMYLVLPHYDFITDLGKNICSNDSEWKSLCSDLYFLIGGLDEDEFDPSIMPVILSNVPSGASYRQLSHYLQEVQSGHFRAFDFGMVVNKEKYNSITPPNYDMTKITAPVALYYGQNDLLASVTDVQRLAAELPNLVKNVSVPMDKFTHLDFLWANDVVKLLNNDLIDLFDSYNKKANAENRLMNPNNNHNNVK